MALADQLRSGIRQLRTVLDNGNLLQTVRIKTATNTLNAVTGEPVYTTATKKALISDLSSLRIESDKSDQAAGIQVTFLENVSVVVGDVLEWGTPAVDHPVTQVRGVENVDGKFVVECVVSTDSGAQSASE